MCSGVGCAVKGTLESRLAAKAGGGGTGSGGGWWWFEGLGLHLGVPHGEACRHFSPERQREAPDTEELHAQSRPESPPRYAARSKRGGVQASCVLGGGQRVQSDDASRCDAYWVAVPEESFAKERGRGGAYVGACVGPVPNLANQARHLTLQQETTRPTTHMPGRVSSAPESVRDDHSAAALRSGASRGSARADYRDRVAGRAPRPLRGAPRGALRSRRRRTAARNQGSFLVDLTQRELL